MKLTIHSHVMTSLAAHSSPFPVAVRSKAYMCSHLVAGVSGSNSVEGVDVCLLGFLACCVCSGLCDELITHSEGWC